MSIIRRDNGDLSLMVCNGLPGDVGIGAEIEYRAPTLDAAVVAADSTIPKACHKNQ